MGRECEERRGGRGAGWGQPVLEGVEVLKVLHCQVGAIKHSSRGISCTQQQQQQLGTGGFGEGRGPALCTD